MSRNSENDSFIKRLFDNPKFKELFWYVFFGVMTTIVAWGSYAILALIFDDFYISFSSSVTREIALADINEKTVFVAGDGFLAFSKVIPANVLSWVIGVVFAFITNKIWVFNSKSWKIKLVFSEFVKFVAARLITGVIEWVGHPLLISLGLNQTITIFSKQLEGFWAKVVISIIVVILNYVFSKLIVFRDRSAQREAKKIEKEYMRAEQEIDKKIEELNESCR